MFVTVGALTERARAAMSVVMRVLYLLAFVLGVGAGVMFGVVGCEQCGGCSAPPYCDEEEERDACTCGCLPGGRSCDIFDGEHYIVGCKTGEGCLDRVPCPEGFICSLPDGELSGNAVCVEPEAP